MYYEKYDSSRPTNVWIKFIPFIKDMWKKRVFEVLGNTWKVLGCL